MSAWSELCQFLGITRLLFGLAGSAARAPRFRQLAPESSHRSMVLQSSTIVPPFQGLPVLSTQSPGLCPGLSYRGLSALQLMKLRLIVGISGASGVIYGIRLLEVL